jgi:molybdopterin converting factor subunit 1
MNIRYFAWLREHIGAFSEDIAYDQTMKTVSDLVDVLRQQSTGHQKALADMTLVRVAVNHVYVDINHPVTAHDEVAFFPPVTGG